MTYCFLSTEETIKSKYEEAKAKLESLYDYNTEGIISNSKVTLDEKEEKSHKYFLNLEKHNKYNTHIGNLMTNRRETTDPTIILEELKTFYGQLYRSKSCKSEAQCYEYLKEMNTQHLSMDQIDNCEGKLNMKKCFEALTAMHSSKSPGGDAFEKNFTFRPQAVISYNVLT